ncbi:hypothetical protein CEXT_802491 [Caerostris extrusa]|uniref:Uncharacterized protein n=1 Tax=Caerostris extrusa TaxID=172846 RepID=A0AAV4PYT5_CAEEX|nr:hypothetical protein CEXT_802491 [Caerostris extrusa]
MYCLISIERATMTANFSRTATIPFNEVLKSGRLEEFNRRKLRKPNCVRVYNKKGITTYESRLHCPITMFKAATGSQFNMGTVVVF